MWLAIQSESHWADQYNNMLYYNVQLRLAFHKVHHVLKLSKRLCQRYHDILQSMCDGIMMMANWLGWISKENELDIL